MKQNKNYTLFIIPRKNGYGYLKTYDSDGFDYLHRQIRKFFYTGHKLNMNYYNYEWIVKDNRTNNYLKVYENDKEFYTISEEENNDYYNEKISSFLE